MATHTGTEGTVKVGSNAVGEVRNWSFSQTAETVDDTTQNDSWRTHKLGMKAWSGSINCFWDEGDTNGQLALTLGASVTLNLYPEGATTGDTYWTGTATITGIEMPVPDGNGMIELNFTFQGNGALTGPSSAA